MYLYELVEEVCALIRPLVREGVTLSNTVCSEMPPVAGDRTRLMQVLFNLVGNASRFTMVGGSRCASKEDEEEQEEAFADCGPVRSFLA